MRKVGDSRWVRGLQQDPKAIELLITWLGNHQPRTCTIYYFLQHYTVFPLKHWKICAKGSVRKCYDSCTLLRSPGICRFANIFRYAKSELLVQCCKNKFFLWLPLIILVWILSLTILYITLYRIKKNSSKADRIFNIVAGIQIKFVFINLKIFLTI